MSTATTTCHSCEHDGPLEPWIVDSDSARVIEAIGARPYFYCVLCMMCGVCGQRVEPGQGAPAAWAQLGIPAIHRTCFASPLPAAREINRRMRSALTRLPESNAP